MTQQDVLIIANHCIKNDELKLVGAGKSSDVETIISLLRVTTKNNCRLFITTPTQLVKSIDSNIIKFSELFIKDNDLLLKQQAMASVETTAQTLVALTPKSSLGVAIHAKESVLTKLSSIVLAQNLTDPDNLIYVGKSKKAYYDALKFLETEYKTTVINSATNPISDKILPLKINKKHNIAFKTEYANIGDNKLNHALRRAFFDEIQNNCDIELIKANIAQQLSISLKKQDTKIIDTIYAKISEVTDNILKNPNLIEKEIFFKVDSFGGCGGLKLGKFSKKNFNKNFIINKICKALSKANIALRNTKDPSKDHPIGTFFLQEMATHPELGDTRIYFRGGKIMSIFTRQALSDQQDVSNLAQGAHLSYIAPTLEECKSNPQIIEDLKKYLPAERSSQAIALIELQQKISHITKEDACDETLDKILQNGFLGFDALISQDKNNKFIALCGEINNNHSTMGPGQVVTKKSLDYLFSNKDFFKEIKKTLECHNIVLDDNFNQSSLTEVKLFFLQQAVLKKDKKIQESLFAKFYNLLQNRFFEIIQKAQKSASNFTYLFYEEEYHLSVESSKELK